jgi:uncharacterized protein with von Willebrand factor type A (vWA) domain
MAFRPRDRDWRDDPYERYARNFGQNEQPKDVERSENTVSMDRFDKQDYAYMRKEMKKLVSATDALAAITPTARPEMADIFSLFLKAVPELKGRDEIRDDVAVDLAVNEQVKDLSEYTQLRYYTRGDVVGSAQAAIRLEPELEVLFDQLKHRQEEAEALQKLRDELLQKLSELIQEQRQNGSRKDEEEPGDGQGEGQEEGEDEGEGSAQGQGQPSEGDGAPGSGQPSQREQDLQQEVQNLRRAIEEGEIKLQEGLDQDTSGVAKNLSDAMKQLTEEAKQEAESARTWGVERGKMLRMPADERLAMAKKLNSDKLRRIAELYGPLSNVAFSPRQRRIEDIPHELSSVTMGSDLEHLLPEELVRLDDPDQEWGFLQDFAEGRLLQYKMFGTEKVGKGGLVLCLDSSSSMSGTPEIMSKAAMLCFLNICKMEQREFHLIHFGSPGDVWEWSFKRPSDYTMERIVEAAEFFASSGTDFKTPLDRAVDILKEEFRRNGRVKSDIVFLTDGQCGVTDAWKESFHEDLKMLDAVCWGIAIGCDQKSEPLWSICQEKVITVQDLTSAGKDLKEIFHGVQRSE